LRKTVEKMSLKFVTVNDNVFQLLGEFVPQTPYRGSTPGPRWGTSIPQTPLACAVLKLPSKIPCCCLPRNPDFCLRHDVATSNKLLSWGSWTPHLSLSTCLVVFCYVSFDWSTTRPFA